MDNPKDIDEYIKGFPEETVKLLNQMRELIKDAAPGSSEKISYGIPTFYFNGNLVHFAGYKNHIGFYPTASGIVEFKTELSSYKTSKGTIQFPIDYPLPVSLIKKIVKFRYEVNLKKVKTAAKQNKPGHK